METQAFRCRLRHNKGAGLALLVLLQLSVTGAAPLASKPQVLLVVVNGVEAPEPVTAIRLIDKRLALRRDVLAALGVPLPDDVGDYVPVDALVGVTALADESNQILRLDFANHDKTRNRLALAAMASQGPLTPSSTGALLNYDVALNANGRRASLQGLLEARLFSQFGALSTSAVANSGAVAGEHGIIRLETMYTLTDVARLRRYTAGDLISGGLPSSRSVRLAGVQLSTDFSVRPDLVTYPVPQLRGSAAVPSMLDILVNGSRVGSGHVAAGDFSVSGAPIINGSGTVDVVLRDALGRESRTSFSVYGVRTLLAPGLSACTLDTGFVRRNYARQSNDYQFLAATATCRIGLSDSLTVEGHGEVAGDLALAGGGALLALGRMGVLSINSAASTAETARGAMSGGQITFGYELIARPISVNLTATRATPGYRDIAARAGDPAPRSSILAQVGIDLQRWGSMSAGVTRSEASNAIDTRALAFQQRAGTAFARLNRVTLLTVSYIASLGHGISLFANGLQDLDRARSTIGVFGVLVTLGPRASATASANRDARGSSGSAQVTQPVTEPGDFGYRFVVDNGASARFSAETRYRGAWGEVSGGVERVQGQMAGRAGIQGALVVADGGLFVGNILQGSFAIVNTHIPDVAVFRDNRPAGRTDVHGRLLVPNLRAFQDNPLAIDPLSLPNDALPGMTELNIRPGDRTGVIARFAARHVRAARVRLVDLRGVPVPAGSRATLNGSAEAVPVGYDGEVYLTELLAENHLAVVQAQGAACVARFAATDPLSALLGPVTCE